MNILLRALIVDDEPPARRWLRGLLGEHPDIDVIAEAGDLTSAAEAAGRLQPDVVFLDVQIPPGTGFDLLPALTERTRVVFVTAHDTYAVRAFEANALDYLLKPVHPERLAESVRRLLVTKAALVPQTIRADIPETLGLQDLVPLQDRGRLRMAAVRDIVAIQADGAYSRVLFSTRPSILVLRSISVWQEALPDPPFARLDRSLLVNVNCIGSLEVRSRDKCLLALKGLPQLLSLGRTASLRVRRLLKTHR